MKYQKASMFMVVIETNIPDLNCSVPSVVVSSRLNMNAAFKVAITYPKPADQLFFSSAIYYQYNMIG